MARFAYIVHAPELNLRAASTHETLIHGRHAYKGNGLADARFGPNTGRLTVRQNLDPRLAPKLIGKASARIRILRFIPDAKRWVRTNIVFDGIIAQILFGHGEYTAILRLDDGSRPIEPRAWTPAYQKAIFPGDKFFDHAAIFQKHDAPRARWPYYWDQIGDTFYPIDTVTPNRITVTLPPRIGPIGQLQRVLVPGWPISSRNFPPQYTKIRSDNTQILTPFVDPANPGFTGRNEGNANLVVSVERRTSFTDYSTPVTVISDDDLIREDVEIGFPKLLQWQQLFPTGFDMTFLDDSVIETVPGQALNDRWGSSTLTNLNQQRFVVGKKLGETVAFPLDGGSQYLLRVIPTAENHLPPRFDQPPARTVPAAFTLALTDLIDSGTSVASLFDPDSPGHPGLIVRVFANPLRVEVLPTASGPQEVTLQASRPGIYLTSKRVWRITVPADFTQFVQDLPRRVLGPGESIQDLAFWTGWGYDLRATGGITFKGQPIIPPNDGQGLADFLQAGSTIVNSGTTAEGRLRSGGGIVPGYGYPYGAGPLANNIEIVRTTPETEGVTVVSFVDRNGISYALPVRTSNFNIPRTPPQFGSIGTVDIRKGATHQLPTGSGTWRTLDSGTCTVSSTGLARAVTLGETIITNTPIGGSVRPFLIRITP